VVNGASRKAMREVLEEIRNGTFAREWIAENQNGCPNYKALLERDLAHPIDPFKSDRMTLGKVGGTQIHLKPSGTQVGTDDASQLDWVPIGTPLKTFLSNLLTALNTLNLPVSGATAGPPAPGTFPVLPTILSSSVEVKK
jgi:hypothetical protein